MAAQAQQKFEEIKNNLQQRNVLNAYEIWDQNFSSITPYNNSLLDYESTIKRLRSEHEIIQSVLKNTQERTNWKSMELLPGWNDLLSIEYLYHSDEKFCKMRAHLLGQVPAREIVTLMRDFALIPDMCKLCKVSDINHSDKLFSSTAVFNINTWYPGLWRCESKTVEFNIFDCMQQHGCVVSTYTWDKNITNPEANVVACLFFPKKRECVVLSATRNAKNKYSLNWMDQYFLHYYMHTTIQNMIDMARKMELFHNDYTAVMKRMWNSTPSYQENTNFEPGQSDSGFYQLLARVF